MLRSKVSNAPKNKFAAFSAFEIKEGMCRKITWRWGKTGWGLDYRIEFGHKLDEKIKAMLRETKENVQGTNSDGKETGTQINSLEQKKERNIQPEKNEETRIQKNEERLRNLQDILKRSNL